MAIPNRGEFPVPPPMKNIKESTARANFFEKKNDGKYFDRAAVHASHLFQAFQYFPDYVNLFMTPGRDQLPTDEMMAEAGETQREDYYPITRDVHKAYFDTNDVSNLTFDPHAFAKDYGSHVFGGTHLLNHPFKKKDNLLLGGLGSYYEIESAQSFFYENMSPNLGYGTTEAEGDEMWSPFKRQGQLSVAQTRSHTILSHLGTSFFQDSNAVMGRLGRIGYEMKGGASGSGHFGYQNVFCDGQHESAPPSNDVNISESSEVYGQKVMPRSITFEGDLVSEDLDGNEVTTTVQSTYDTSNIWVDINAETDELAKELSSQDKKYFENQHGYNNKLSGAYISLFADKSTNGSLTGSFDPKGKLSALDLDNAKNMYLMAASEFESINRYQLGWFEMVGPANEAPNPYRDFDADNGEYQANDEYYDANRAYTEKYWDVFKEEHLSQLHMKNRYYLEPFVYLNHLEDNYVRKVFSVVDPETLRPYEASHSGLSLAPGDTDNDEYYDYILKTMIHSSAYLGDVIQNGKQIGDKSLADALNAMGVSATDVLTTEPHDMFTTPNGIENVEGNYLDPEKARELYQAAMVTFRYNTEKLDRCEILKNYGAYFTTSDTGEDQLVLSEFGRKMMLNDIADYESDSKDFLSERYSEASWLNKGSWAWVQHITGDDLKGLEAHLTELKGSDFSDDFPTAAYAISGSTDAAKTVLAALGPYVQYIMGGRHKFEQVYTDEFAGWRTNDNVSTYVDSWAFLAGTIGHDHGRDLTWAPSRHMVFLNSSDRKKPDVNDEWAIQQSGALMAFSNLLDDGKHLTSADRAFDDQLDLYQRKASWRHVLHTDVHLTSEDHHAFSASVSMRNRMRWRRYDTRMREWTELKKQFEEGQLNERLAQKRAQERRAEQVRFAQEAAQRREAERRRSQES